MRMQMRLFFILISFLFLIGNINVEAGSWSQTTQVEFETCSQSGIDTRVNPGSVEVVNGTYVTDDNTVLLMHFNEGTGNPYDDSGQGNNGSKSAGDRCCQSSG